MKALLVLDGMFVCIELPMVRSDTTRQSVKVENEPPRIAQSTPIDIYVFETESTSQQSFAQHNSACVAGTDETMHASSFNTFLENYGTATSSYDTVTWSCISPV